MNLRNLSHLTILAVLIATGCTGSKYSERLAALRRDPGWPAIRTAAEKEIARREGGTNWSGSAYYAPRQHTNGVWAVVASGAYPNNRMGDSIDLLIRDGGEIIYYAPRWPSRSQ